MQTLADFLNHGILPFVGRSAEIDRIVRFWRATTQAHNLRALCITGESGIGKSRLVEETMHRVVMAGGAFVHVKIFSESTSSIAPLIASAIWRSGAGRRLLSKEPAGRLPDVVAALAHLARLRPTMLALEDIHLLNGESLRDFGSLLGALEGELISTLCVTRPMETGSRGVLERYLVDEIELTGLNSGEIGALWESVFETQAGQEVLDALLHATAGNPLALRSALRGAISSGSLILDATSRSWRPTVTPTAFSRRLQANVRLIAEGLAAHLSQREREAAEQLAALGEIFSREAAWAMLDDASRILEALTFKGIVVTSSSSVPPIPGAASDYPLLTFTHSLVHRYFTQGADVSTGRLLGVVINDLPLYSTLAFNVLAASGAPETASLTDIRRAFQRTVDVARLLDVTPDWEMGKKMLDTAQVLIDSRQGEWPEREERELRSELLHFRLVLSKREMHSAAYEDLVLEFLAITENPTTDTLLRCRLVALSHLYWLRTIRGNATHCEPLRQMDELLERFPELRSGNAYVYFLYKVAYSAASLADKTMLQEIEERLALFQSQHDIPEERRNTAWRMISPLLLTLFDSEAELRARLDALAILDAGANRRDTLIKYRKIAFLQEICRYDDMLAAVEEGLPSFKEYGLIHDVFLTQLYRIAGEAAIGGDLTSVTERIRSLVDEGEGVARECSAELVRVVAQIGILRGDRDWTLATLAEVGEEGLPPEARALLAPTGAPGHRDETMLPPALRALMRPEGPEDPESTAREIRELLAAPLLRASDLIERLACIELVDRAAHPSLTKLLGPDLGRAALGMLAWLEGVRLPAYMRPIHETYGNYLTAAEANEWKKRIAALEGTRKSEGRNETGGGRLRITMLGTVQVRTESGEIIRIRGARLRVLLGLMAADRMLERPLAYREFLRIAAGDDDSGVDNGTDGARNIVKVSVHRLREILGHDAILTDAEAPRLNPDRIEIDLVDAHHLLHDATTAARQEMLARALDSLRRALDLIGGEVAFPSLYDNFFEAARVDFEIELRTAILAVGNGLLREGDAAGAREILERGFRIMPEDEELADLLRAALAATGRNADALLVGLNVAEEV